MKWAELLYCCSFVDKDTEALTCLAQKPIVDLSAAASFTPALSPSPPSPRTHGTLLLPVL